MQVTGTSKGRGLRLPWLSQHCCEHAATRYWSWLPLAMILGGFLLYLWRLDPISAFGQNHDDALYFSSAQALAEGKGYRSPSLPGSPAQTKYPILWSAILSLVWRWFPEYPSNLRAATWIVAAFGCWFLIASFLVLRRLSGLGERTALLITALCAFQPFYVLLAGGLMSDIPFGALLLTTAVLSEAGLRPRARNWVAAAAGVTAGLSVLMRLLGAAVVAGVVGVALLRRAWRPLGFFCAAALPVVAAGLLAAGHPPLLGGFLAEGGGPGWRQTWTYYTSYLGFWRLNVPDFGALCSLLASNVEFFLQTPAAYCLAPPAAWLGPQLGAMLNAALTVGILAGIARQIRAGGWQPLHAIFVFYLPLVLLWNYGYLLGRFLIPFLPLLYAGLWVEGSRLIAALRRGLGPARPGSERMVAGVLTLAVAAVLISSVNSYVRGFRRQIHEQAALRASLQREKEELFEWVRGHTSPGTRFVSFEDVTLYLATRRQAVWPIAFLPAGVDGGDQRLVERDLAHITDVASHIGARYWASSESQVTVSGSSGLLDKRYAELKSVLPVAFRTSRDHFRVYDLACVQEPRQQACEKALPVLFPTERVPIEVSRRPFAGAATVP